MENRAPMTKAEARKQRREAHKQNAATYFKVELANKQKDPLEQLSPAFRTYQRNGLSVSFETMRVAQLEAETIDWALDLLEKNMKALYEESSWGWNRADKQREMTDEAAWYLIGRCKETGKPVAYSHFRFDTDDDVEILYCYEIQLEDSVRNKGLGTFMIKLLELLSFKYNEDSTNPLVDIYDHILDEVCDYWILSKSTEPPRKKK